MTQEWVYTPGGEAVKIEEMKKILELR